MHEYKLGKIIYASLFLFFVFIDQISKYIIRFGGGFYICNKNFAFGLTLEKLLIVIPGFILILFIFNFRFSNFPAPRDLTKRDNFQSIYNFKFKKLKHIGSHKISLILIASGAISNIIDRLSFGCVIDFIDLKFWPLFNLADIYITIGAIMILSKLLAKREN
jgi:lipoprotein signal peptidase